MIALIVSVLLTGLTCHRQLANMQLDQPVQDGKPPNVRIEVRPTVKLKSPLAMHWTISNVGTSPIYVYSTFLKHQWRIPAFSYTDLDPAQRLIDIRFTQLKSLPGGINSFSDAEFIEIRPQESREGTFATNGPLEQETFYSSKGEEIKAAKLTSGSWTLRIVIAYGYEISSVNQALAESLSVGKEHPINPIVRWQKLAYSEPVSVTFQK